jgi:P4 family phage/plasmid primase-like protien
MSVKNFTAELITEALSYGFKPVLIYTDISKGVGKAPIEKDWIGKYSTISQDELLKITKHRSNDNVGILCGEYSNIIVIDVDVQDNGVENWIQLCNEHGIDDIQSFNTPTVLSGSLGYHYYFKYNPSFKNLKKKLAPGIDILSTGKQIIFPGSLYPGCVPKSDDKHSHKCGSNNFDDCLFHANAYEWLKSPSEHNLQEIPDWLQKLIIKPLDEVCKKNQSKEDFKEDIKDDISLIKECLKILKKKADPYSEWIEVIWCIRALGFSKDIAHFFSKFSLKYDAKSVDDIWDRYNENKVSWNWGSIRNWLKENLTEDEYNQFCNTHFKHIEDEFRLYEGDYGLAKIFSDLNKNKLIITDEKGCGFYFNNKKKIWQEYTSNYLCNLISKDLLPIVNHFLEKYLEKNSKKNKEDENEEEEDGTEFTLKNLYKVKHYVLSTRGCKQIFVKVMFNLLNKDFLSKLDNDPHHLPIKDGKVINLKDGSVRDRTSNDYFTFECPVSYNKNDRTIVYDYIKSICVGDINYTDWMIKFLGYILTRETSDRSLYILWGKGMNGKSKLLELVECILGKLFTSCSADVLLKHERKGGATPELIPLISARVAVLNETNEEDKLNSERIKKLTGDDLITARALFKDEITFRPKAKLLLITNKKPNFDVTDKAMTDRIKLIPFLACFDNNNKNRQYIDDLKTKYLDDFFSLIIDGCISWWKDKNLNLPEIALQETKKYFEENDTILQWINECCELGKSDDYREQPSILYSKYSDWCILNDYKRDIKQKFGEVMTSKFGEKNKVSINKKQVWIYSGIKIL